MEKLIIEGGNPLKGEVKISGSKNATLPIMAATLLTDEPCVIKNVPHLRDTTTMVALLRSLGKEVEFNDNKLTITSGGKLKSVADYKLVSTMRGSFCVLGPLLAKLKTAKVSLPGGCVIGIRPVDLHLKGLKALGTKIEIENGYVIARCRQLKGAQMYLGGGFGSSVLATANVMMAAVLAKGETVIEAAACEPEIEDLSNMLIAMGAKIKGKGSPRLVITGVKKLRGVNYKVIPDRIETGTYIIMAAATRSNISIRGGDTSHLMALVDTLGDAGVKVYNENGVIKVKCKKNINPTSITTYPYPGFPTDLQAQFLALMTMAQGVSVITDKVYPDRFIHIAELNRMGANIRREGVNAISQGVKELYGAPVMASDLRASAALVIAGLAAKGVTEIHRIYHLERGYEDLEGKLKGLGAVTYRKNE
ncbi:MAG: UDP-N-acetylglucosamine 1-carboxyvinyltransferase [Candidatus Omnitrophica bacterium]|nr:UDP-N-acetylglucosamine 1-carboxyvinyltransferase [Candidatus Omnitrophota bacterium]MBU1997214.1 UDP-N-acetylglucosamine 1-carboxyvinyltransferase [Candidatus Omnitrophota bacterium]MBU4334796.1 UDP-N-acetylglucosamine 1-carboxyvinyltransferase [Candidatus Omnitrophota bacterium]